MTAPYMLPAWGPSTHDALPVVQMFFEPDFTCCPDDDPLNTCKRSASLFQRIDIHE
jgi:hypothetical protein